MASPLLDNSKAFSLKECSESEYWLELLIEGGYRNDRMLLDQCIEVKKLLIASINTAKQFENRISV